MQSLTKPNVILFTALFFLLYYSTWVSKQLSITETKGMEGGISHSRLPNKKVRCVYHHLRLYHQSQTLKLEMQPWGLSSLPIREKSTLRSEYPPRQWGVNITPGAQASRTHRHSKQFHPWVRRPGRIFTACIFKFDLLHLPSHIYLQYLSPLAAK